MADKQTSNKYGSALAQRSLTQGAGYQSAIEGGKIAASCQYSLVGGS
ncbi:hypothetical protein GO988_10825 [Hymenobacter sp. HMF4947]|uniref:Uncharacterized protein n=1 Tax=Hymenobacter ginkgonis TaxID=2682976 RepID=A0A7K1TEI4_9BACT|nr:hypothetical protein [Hymenobacter ginkgonis]MVN76816.1 hypothetical protein [Hymenobacter ginkgonis]